MYFGRAQVAMLARDEEQLLKKHLVHWRGIGDSFLIGLDSRNKDLGLAEGKPCMKIFHNQLIISNQFSMTNI